MAFTGFGSGAQHYFKELAAHNDKNWFDEHRSTYDTELRDPAEAFIFELGALLTG